MLAYSGPGKYSFVFSILLSLDFTIPKIELCKNGVSQVILANKNAKGKFLIKGIENAFQDKTIDIRIFGKPTAWPGRRLGLIFSSDKENGQAARNFISVVEKKESNRDK